MSGQLPAARITDPTTHATPTAPGPGAPTVLIEGRPAWRTMLDTHLCPMPSTPPHGPEKIYLGSTTVLINNQMACRMGDILQGMGPPNFVEMGSPTVLIGDNGFGMGRDGSRIAFATAGHYLFESWDRLSRLNRLAALQRALNAALPTEMPVLSLKRNPALDPDTYGQFSFRRWSVEIHPDIFPDIIDKESMTQLLNTTYHEARHGEQWWNAAQYLAGQDYSTDQIEAATGIPIRVAEAAVEHPALDGTSEGAMGEAVYESVYGSRSDYREQVMSAIDPDTYRQYRALPEEEDAWRHGDEVGLEFGEIVWQLRDL